MIVDDRHAMAAVLAAQLGPTSGTPRLYLDARVPAIMHLRLVSALFKPGRGQLTDELVAAAPDPATRTAMLDRIALPRRGLRVLDDRPLALAIGALTAERGVSVAFAALIAHAQAAGQPILAVPGNEARWIGVAEGRGVEVIVRSAQIIR